MKKSSTLFLQLVIVLIGIAALAALLWEPQVEGRNAHATLYQVYFNDPFLVLVYTGSVAFFVGLYQAFTVLRYVGQNEIFTQHAVKALRTIKYCAIIVIGFVAVEEFFIMLNHGDDDPAGGVFVGALIVCGSFVIVKVAAMFERIVQKAVEIKTENDLTV